MHQQCQSRDSTQQNSQSATPGCPPRALLAGWNRVAQVLGDYQTPGQETGKPLARRLPHVCNHCSGAKEPPETTARETVTGLEQSGYKVRDSPRSGEPSRPSEEVGRRGLETGGHRQSPLRWALPFFFPSRKALREGCTCQVARQLHMLEGEGGELKPGDLLPLCHLQA